MVINNERSEDVNIEVMINDFVKVAIETGGWMALDQVYLRHRLSALIGEPPVKASHQEAKEIAPIELVSQLTDVAVANGIASTKKEIESLRAQICDLLTPPPSVLNALFAQQYEGNPKVATDYFYQVMRTNLFIHSTWLDNKPMATSYGTLFIKEESSDKNYADMLHLSNEGMTDKESGMALAHHRAIRMNLNQSSWGYAFHPYPSFEEHAWFIPETKMSQSLTRDTLSYLFQLADLFPHYFVAFAESANVEQESLSFQGGLKKRIPLFEAEGIRDFNIPGFIQIKTEFLDWYQPTIRITGKDKRMVLNAIDYLSLKWKDFSYPSLGITPKSEAFTNNHPIGIIVRNEEEYIVDLVLSQGEQELTLTDSLGIISYDDKMPTEEKVSQRLKEMQLFQDSEEGAKALYQFFETL